MGRIVVGVDGSPASAGALTWAMEEAAQTDSSVHAVGAWSFPAVAALPLDSSTLPELRRTAASRVQHVVGDAAGVTWSIEQGEPAEVLCEAARDADLLVVGARGLGGFRRLLLGSVSHAVLRHAERPVVVVPTGATYRRSSSVGPAIVVGVDDRGGSRRALRLAVERARRWHASCVAVHACSLAGSPTTLVLETVEVIESAGHALLEAEVEAVDPGVVKVEHRLVFDGAARALLELADAADLLVVGRNEHRILGSVADTCAGHATCPVLVVPA